MITSFASAPVSVEKELTFFAFDDHSIPLRDNLYLTLKQVEKHPENPVLRKGPMGAHDETGCIIYGTVLSIDGKLRMWYMPQHEKHVSGKPPGRPMSYAESTDGVHWKKPNLGLVSWNGSKDNNICRVEPSKWYTDDYNSIIYEPEDPNPERRYKMAFRSRAHHRYVRSFGVDPDRNPGGMASVMVAATSSDGLRWKVVQPDRITIPEYLESSGLYKFNGCYYVFGQQNPPRVWLPDGRRCGRVMSVFQSFDFENWTTAKSVGFIRPGYVSKPSSEGEEIHMAAGLWNRQNVLVGLYGMWHGAPAPTDKEYFTLHNVRIDLGLVVSNDGLHYREPIPDFAVIPRSNSSQWDSIGLTPSITSLR